MHRRLLGLARDSRLALAITILSGLLAGWLTIGQAWLLSSTVNAVFLQSKPLAQVWLWLQWILLIILARALLAWMSEISANALAVRVKTDLRQRLFTHILNLGPAFSRGQRTGELTAATVEGIEALDAYFSQYLPQLVIAALVPLSILLLVFPIDLLSATILLLTAPLIPFFMILIGKGAESVTKKQYETLSRLSAHFLDSLQGLTTLKLFGQSKAHAQNIARVSEQFRDVTLRVLRITFLSALALELLSTISTAIIAVEIGLRLLYGRMEFQPAFFLLILAPEFYLPLRMLGLRFHAGMAGTSAARRIFEILDIPVDNREQRIEATSTQPNRSSNDFRFSALQLSNISFTYPGELQPTLQNMDLTINAGQQVALVGRTGSGKSTVVNLLLGFIRPSRGCILVNGRPLDAANAPVLRHQIAWVPQKPHLFHDTISANIRLGKPDASQDEIIAAAQDAHLHDFIQSLPQGYETLIGEGGARLSGGEAQRLALARAFLKNAPILILDEPTSSLDPETESLLEDSTHRLMPGRTARGERSRTVITIAHRLSTVFQADKIFVIEEGRVAETGTHHELLTKPGIYARMVTAHQTDSSEVAQSKEMEGAGENRQPTAFQSPVENRKSLIQNRNPSIFFRLINFLQGSWNWVALSVLLGTLTVGSNVALMGASAWLIAAAALQPSIAELEVAIVGVRFFGISRAVFRYLERLVSHNVTFRLLARLRVWFYEKLEPLAPARLMEHRAGDLLARIVADVDVLEDFYVRVIAPPLTALVVALGVSLFLASFDARLGFTLFGFMLGLGLLLPLLAQSLSCTASADLVRQRANLHARLVDSIQGLADLLAFGRASDQQCAIDDSSREIGHAQRKLALISGLNAGFSVLLANLCLWTVFVMAIPLITAGNIDGMLLGMLALVTLASFEAVTPLPLAAQKWESTREAARRLFEVVDTEPTVKENREQRLETGITDSSLTGHSSPFSTLEFSDLSFTYPGNAVPALQSITFSLQPGQRIAIVGPSGAGKSTLVSLLLRFWNYSQGTIALDGHSLHDYSPDEVRQQIAVVSQSSYFFNASIRQNLKLARATAGQAEIEEAARQAGAHEFIASLTKGYDTLIGEQGLRLSGGERQRLAIARAILRNAPIIILDEPTANLDSLTERFVLETVFEATKGKSILLITHRLIQLEKADEILVMEGGRIVERGTHAKLQPQDGRYRRLWDLQNRILTEA
jgi:ATP-binding cassette subfamily C protein CydCD